MVYYLRGENMQNIFQLIFIPQILATIPLDYIILACVAIVFISILITSFIKKKQSGNDKYTPKNFNNTPIDGTKVTILNNTVRQNVSDMEQQQYTSPNRLNSRQGPLYTLFFGIMWTIISGFMFTMVLTTFTDSNMSIVPILMLGFFICIGLFLIISSIVGLKKLKKNKKNNQQQQPNVNSNEQNTNEPLINNDDYFIKYCPNCGSPLKPNQKFCDNCGANCQEMTKK